MRRLPNTARTSAATSGRGASRASQTVTCGGYRRGTRCFNATLSRSVSQPRPPAAPARSPGGLDGERLSCVRSRSPAPRSPVPAADRACARSRAPRRRHGRAATSATPGPAGAPSGVRLRTCERRRIEHEPLIDDAPSLAQGRSCSERHQRRRRVVVTKRSSASKKRAIHGAVRAVTLKRCDAAAAGCAAAPTPASGGVDGQRHRAGVHRRRPARPSHAVVEPLARRQGIGARRRRHRRRRRPEPRFDLVRPHQLVDVARRRPHARRSVRRARSTSGHAAVSIGAATRRSARRGPCSVHIASTDGNACMRVDDAAEERAAADRCSR